MGESLQRIGKARHYTTREEADRDCKELNEDRNRWYYGKVQKYTATLASDCTATGSPFDAMSPEERSLGDMLRTVSDAIETMTAPSSCINPI